MRKQNARKPRTTLRHTAQLWLVTGAAAGSLLLAGCSAGTDTTVGAQVAAMTAASATADAATTGDTVAATATAAQEFLGTLSEEQQEQVSYAYDDENRTTTWSNFPVTFVERAGINLNDFSEQQRAAAMKVLETLLNEDSYEMVTGIMGGDEYLNENSSSSEDSLGQYYLAFYGDPTDTGTWGLQFGGHHIGLNATLGADAITFAPTHFGVQPAEYTDENGTTVKPLERMYESAFAFYDSLSGEQQEQLYQGGEVQNMVCAPGDTCDFPTGTGLKGSDLNDGQKQLLLELISHWAALGDEETSQHELSQIEATLDDTYVNWSGATTYDTSTGDGIYFQISGPKAYIEFANQQGSAGADVDGVVTAGWGHVHTIYRDPGSDYAGDATQQESSGMSGGPGGGTPPGEEL